MCMCVLVCVCVCVVCECCGRAVRSYLTVTSKQLITCNFGDNCFLICKHAEQEINLNPRKFGSSADCQERNTHYPLKAPIISNKQAENCSCGLVPPPPGWAPCSLLTGEKTVRGVWQRQAPGRQGPAPTRHLINATRCRMSGFESSLRIDPFITLHSMSVQEQASFCLGQMSLQVIDGSLNVRPVLSLVKDLAVSAQSLCFQFEEVSLHF